MNWTRLSTDNFTPLTRTPWGGEKITQLKGLAPGRVGESWELSLGPEFPSMTPHGSLWELVQRQAHWIGEHPPSLLVKLLDTAQNLSLQIHPHDDDPALSDDESGKPESWYIIDHEDGAGLYLGFKEGVDDRQVRSALSAQDDITPLLHFVPVRRGDFFVIDAGTPHAIGAGITLVEPQRVQAGKRGLTYRYWDWNRLYDKHGVLSPSGRPRPLHVDRALAVTDWQAPREQPFVERCRVRISPYQPRQALSLTPLRPPASDWPLGAWRLSGSGTMQLRPQSSLSSLTVIQGRLWMSGDDVPIGPGQSIAIAANSPMPLRGDALHALISTSI